MVRPVINSEKRIVQIPIATVVMGSTANVNIVRVEQTVSSTNPTHVSAGTVCKAVYLELWVVGSANVTSSVAIIAYKLVSEAASPDAADMVALNAWGNKKNIFETHQGVIGDQNTNPVPFWRGWIKIPKGKQRFGLGDTFKITIAPFSGDVQFCGVAIFKAYN